MRFNEGKTVILPGKLEAEANIGSKCLNMNEEKTAEAGKAYRESQTKR